MIQNHLFHYHLKCNIGNIYFVFGQHLQKIVFYMESWFTKFLRSKLISLISIVSFLAGYISWHSSGHLIQWCFSFRNTSSVEQANLFYSTFSEINISIPSLEHKAKTYSCVLNGQKSVLSCMKPHNNCEQRRHGKLGEK